MYEILLMAKHYHISKLQILWGGSVDLADSSPNILKSNFSIIWKISFIFLPTESQKKFGASPQKQCFFSNGSHTPWKIHIVGYIVNFCFRTSLIKKKRKNKPTQRLEMVPFVIIVNNGAPRLLTCKTSLYLSFSISHYKFTIIFVFSMKFHQEIIIISEIWFYF